MSRVEGGDGLSLIINSWLGTEATCNCTLIRGVPRVEASNGLGLVLDCFLSTQQVLI